MSMVEMLRKSATLRGIPMRPVAPGSSIWRFGQGSASRHLYAAATDRDGLTGTILSRNKGWANALVAGLGFPATVQRVVHSRAELVAQARALGFPVAVKPLSAGMGMGVCAEIRTEADLLRAHANAAPLSPQGMVVERHVAGLDHRLTVCGGRLTWAVIRHRARVTGDGVHAIRDLISLENARRSATFHTERLKPITIDDELVIQLQNQALTLESRPAAGAPVALRSVANVARGGTVEDCTARVHPAVRDMAEAIARAARLDVIGVDFITPDVTRSWRDVPCAVIEINATPAIFTDQQADVMVEALFPPGSDGRIPTVLLVDVVPAAVDLVAGALAAGGRRVGRTDTADTQLGGAVRCEPGMDIAARVEALVADPACQALVVAVPAAEVVRGGLPLDRFDVAFAPARLPQPAESFMAGGCREVVRATPEGAIEAAVVSAALGRMLGRYTPRRPHHV
jgi:cyanophycin synthetase